MKMQPGLDPIESYWRFVLRHLRADATVIQRFARNSPKSALALLVAFGLALSWWMWPTPSANQLVLRAAKVWDYQLQKPNIDRLANSASDLVVADASFDANTGADYTKPDLERMRQRPDGRQRLVIAYLSIGEAEEYRPYWKPEWKTQPPPWLFEENCRWPKNYVVGFWMDAWKDLMFRGPQSSLKRILDAGFDGVYLDRIDAYWDLREKYPNGRAEMLKFMKELATAARKVNPQFLIIAQNAEDLLEEPAYRAAIDAVAKEDLLYGVEKTGVRNDKQMVDESLAQLRLLAKEDKPVFVVEYLQNRDDITKARRELAKLGMHPTFPPRALDGSDPLRPDPVTETGTPEYRAAHCKAS